MVIMVRSLFLCGKRLHKHHTNQMYPGFITAREFRDHPELLMPPFRRQSRPMARKKSVAQQIVDAARAKRKARSSYRGKRYLGGGGAGGKAQALQTNYRILNTRSIGPQKVIRTCNYSLTYGVNFTNSSPAAAFIFDPSGTYGNTSTAGTGLAMPDWTSLVNLYDFYRVNNIKITFRYANTGALIGSVPMWMRYNYEGSVVTPTIAGVTSLAQVHEVNFNNDNPMYSYSFKPCQRKLVDNAAVLASEGRAIEPHGWTDVNFPVELWGFQCITSYALATTQTLFFEIEYDVDFKYAK